MQTSLQTSQMKMIILKCNQKKKKYFILYKMDPNYSIVNNAYHSAVLSGLVITNSVLATKLLNMKSVDLGKFSVNPCSPEGFSQTYFPKGGVVATPPLDYQY